MSKVESVRMLINQSLSLAAAEIFELFERTIAEYEEQIRLSKQENHKQQTLLDAVFSTEIRLHRTDIQQVLVGAESVGGEQQERGGLSLDQEDPPEPAHIKEEEETWSHQETEEQLHGDNQEEEEEEEEDSEFTLTPVPAKNQEEEEEEAESSQLHDKQPEDMLDSQSETDDSSYYLEEFAPPHSPLNHRTDMETEETALTFSESASTSEQIQNHEETFVCSVCSKSFTRKSNLLRHLKTHSEKIQHESNLKIASDVKSDTGNNLESSSASSSGQKQEPQKGEKRFICPVCDKGFNTRGNLNQHISCHLSKESHICLECGKIFFQKRYLKQHMILHSGVKPHCCTECGRKFLKPSQLKEHLAVHTGEKPFSCNVCDRKFVFKRYLSEHMMSHSGEKPFCCHLCGKRFLKKSRLKEHAAVHTGEKQYSCDVCDKKFLYQRYLREHMFCHSREKPHICPQCGKRFLKPSHLKDHAAVHTGEKPYACNVCDRSFARADALRKHTCDPESSRSK